MLGFDDPSGLPGSSTLSFHVDPEDREGWRSLIDQQGMTRHYEVRLKRRDGKIIWARENARAVRDENDELLYYEGSLEDITELKQAEEAIRRLNAELELRVIERTAQLKAANKELEAFSYSVSHDLRTPLRALDGYSKLLLEEYAEVVDDNGKYYLESLRSASQRMGELIDDLLMLSRITRSDIRIQEINLSNVASKIATELQNLEPERHVEFVIQNDLTDQADINLMQIVLENLLGNAWKFTARESSARIEFGCVELNEKKVYYVRDNGAGFDMAYVDKLFGAFQRLHSDMEFDGTGIGLATVQRIIRRHAGRIWAEGALEHGATFYFTLSS
jgi:light-regulated signal transduction histidine kinase (bacteriophytochrome)